MIADPPSQRDPFGATPSVGSRTGSYAAKERHKEGGLLNDHKLNPNYSRTDVFHNLKH